VGVGEMVLSLRAETAAFSKGLDRARGDLRGFRADVTSIGGGGIAGQLAAAGLGMRQLTGLLRVGLDAVRGISAGIRRDWEGMDAALRTMPMGIGAVYGAVRDLRSELDGTAAAIRAADKAWEDFQEAAAGRAKFVKGLMGMRATAADLAGEALILEAEAGGDPELARALKVREEQRKGRESILAKAKAEGLEPSHPAVTSALAGVDRIAKAKLGAGYAGTRAFGPTLEKLLHEEQVKKGSPLNALMSQALYERNEQNKAIRDAAAAAGKSVRDPDVAKALDIVNKRTAPLIAFLEKGKLPALGDSKGLAGIVTDRLTRAGLPGEKPMTAAEKAVIEQLKKLNTTVTEIKGGGGLG